MTSALASLRSTLFASPRRVLALIAIVATALLAFGFYLQHAVGLEPCPMCIVQRYAFVLLIIVTGLGSLWGNRWWSGLWGLLGLLVSGFGAFVAARQSLLQWNPPEFMSCGRDFYGIIEGFPLREAIPRLFRGSGDCSAVDWTFLGGSIANWSFVWFAIFFIALLTLGVAQLRGRDSAA